MVKSAKVASKKQVTTFPLWKHEGTGQWCKKIKGRMYYFGKDKDAAAKRWNDEKDALYAGETPRSRGNKATIVELANLFSHDQRERYQTTGKPGLRHIELCEDTIKRLVSFAGQTCVVADLSPNDFAKIKLHLFQPVKRTKPVRGKVFGRVCEKRAPETVAGDIRRIKLFLNWCKDSEYIPEPRFGNKFATATEVAITKVTLKKSAESSKKLDASSIHAIMEKCPKHFKPIILVAANAGIGNTDIAAIEFDDLEDIDKEECWIDLPRLKTEAPRRFLLWPETKSAIKEYLKIRPEPKSSQYANTVFLTSHGIPWIRGEGHFDRVDSIGMTFTKARKAAGLSRGSFYDLRRTFATIGCETLDFAAVKLLMGHAKNSRDMTDRYTQEIGDDRLKKVTDHVRTWLFPPTKKAAKTRGAK